MNRHVNIEVPSTLTNNIIIPNSNQFGNPQRIINYNPNINIQGQFQQVPIQNSAVIQNQMFPRVIVINVDEKKKIKTCEPTKILCPYCQIEVISEPTLSWTNKSCNSLFQLIVFSIITCGMGFLVFLCETNSISDCCCYEADHLCPKCKKIIDKRKLSYYLKECYYSVCKRDDG